MKHLRSLIVIHVCTFAWLCAIVALSLRFIRACQPPTEVRILVAAILGWALFYYLSNGVLLLRILRHELRAQYTRPRPDREKAKP